MKHEFQTCRIADIAEKVAMGPFGSNIKVETFVPAGVPIISGAHLKGFYLEENDFNFITEEHAQRLKNSIVYPDDIIFTHAGNVGQVAMIPYNCHYPFYMISQRQFYLRCNKEKVLPEYLTYYFHSYEGQGKLLSNVSQVGVPSIAQPSSFLKTIEVPLPLLSVQRRIVNILDSFTKKIEVNNQINRNLEEQAKAIFKSWFVDFEPFGGEQPDDWKKGTIADLGNVVGGGTPSKAKDEYYCSRGIPWITPKDLSVNKSKFISRGQTDISDAGLNNSSAIIMPKGTVLFSSRAPIGYIAIAKNEVTTNQGFKSVVPHPHIGTPFVYLFLKHNLEKIESVASGSTFKEVSGGVMKSIPALIPDNNSLSKFTAQCQPLFQKQEALEAENNILQETRDTLLPKLMSGEMNLS
ncbi:MAG: restriction endonuclease subunit S [Lentisphaeria bacterium]|nr:restriction endonuclease subunit S [Lentisphaeria bacterium]